MKNLRICTFAANYNHAAIVVENFIKNEYKDVNVLIISEKEDLFKEKFSKCSGISFFTWKDEYVTVEKQKIIFVVYGSEVFIQKVNKYIRFGYKEAYIIDAYDISNLESDINDILIHYDYYLNTQGLQIKYWELYAKDI